MKSHATTGTRLRRAAFAAALLAPVLTACGFGAQTDQIYQAAQGTDDRTTSVKILNATIVAGTNGAGTFAGSFVNESGADETIVNVTADGVTAGSGQQGPITIPARSLLNAGKPVTVGGKERPLLVLTGTPIEIGHFVRLTFEFSGAGKVVINVQVVGSVSEVGKEYDGVVLPPGSEPTTDEGSEPAAGEEPTEEPTH